MWEGLGTAWDSLKSFRRFIFENSRSFRTELRACRRRLQYSSASSLIRRVGRFLLNLLIAVMGTAVIESGFHPAFRPGSFALLDAVAAFGLGCTVITGGGWVNGNGWGSRASAGSASGYFGCGPTVRLQFIGYCLGLVVSMTKAQSAVHIFRFSRFSPYGPFVIRLARCAACGLKSVCGGDANLAYS
jgi:hypothetical protein